MLILIIQRILQSLFIIRKQENILIILSTIKLLWIKTDNDEIDNK